MDSTEPLSLLVAALEDRLPYAKSVVLIGSRADDRYGKPQNADFDLVVVLPTWRIPLALSSMRRLADDVSKKFGTSVSINPVPVRTIKKPSDNFMVLKMVEEGQVISGQALRTYAGTVKPEEITAEWRLFYLASQAKRLLDVCAQPTHANDPDALAAAMKYAAGKAIIACGELEVLAGRGKYVSHPLEVEAELRAGNGDELADLVQVAAKWITGSSADSGGDGGREWMLARNTLLTTLDAMAMDLAKASGDTPEFEDYYLTSAGIKRFIRNLQYGALSVLGGSLPVRPLISNAGTAERIKLALFHLLRARDMSTGMFDHNLVQSAERLLRPFSPWKKANSASGTTERWTTAYGLARSVYPRACVALGI